MTRRNESIKTFFLISSVVIFTSALVLASASCSQNDLFSELTKKRILSPADIPGLMLWLKTDSLTGYVNNDPIANWPDSSGNGNDAYVAAGTPTFATNAVNGQPAVYFNTGAYLETPEFMSFADTTIFWVARKNVGGTDQGLFYNSGSAPSKIEIMQDPGLTKTEAKSPTFSLINNFSSSVIVPHIGVFVIDNQLTMVVFNGLSQSVSDGSYTPTIWSGAGGTPPRIGYSSFMLYDGYIAEMIVFNHALSESDGFAVDCFLSSKYGITVAHPCE
jgi:hypothetical protein